MLPGWSKILTAGTFVYSWTKLANEPINAIFGVIGCNTVNALVIGAMRSSLYSGVLTVSVCNEDFLDGHGVLVEPTR